MDLSIININYSNCLPRLYCKYAATNKPKALTVIIPKTIPDNKGSTIYF